MADGKSAGGQKPLPRKSQPKTAPLIDEAFDSALGHETPGALGPASQNRKQKPEAAKNRLLIASLAGGGTLLVLLLVLGLAFGWFGRGEAKKPIVPAMGRSSPVVTNSPASTKPTVPPTATSTPDQTSKPQVTPGPTPESKSERPKPAATKPLTDDFTKWRNADWSRARRENHPKLREAVLYLGSERFAGKESVAKGLTGLLKAIPPEKAAGSSPKSATGTPSPGLFTPPSSGLIVSPNSRQAGAANATLIEALVTALGNNGSEPARKTLADVIAGVFATDDDKTAVESAVKTLVARPSSDGDALLVRLLVAPETVRSAEHEGPWPAKTLQAKTFELAKQSQSAGLRTAIGKAVIERGEIINPDDSLHKFLLEDSPLNCGAQVLLYNKAAKPELRAKLEQQLVGYSSQAMAICLAIPGHAGNGPSASGLPEQRGTDRFAPATRITPSTPTAPASDAVASGSKPSELAGPLWAKAFRTAIESELDRSSSPLDKQASLLLLAGTMPYDSTRAMLVKALGKRLNTKVTDEPAPLETAGLVDKLVTDPAWLVLLKLSRKEAGSSRAVRPGIDKSRLPEAARKKQEADEKWASLCQKLAEAWCKRLGSAAQAKQDAKAGAGEPGDSALPAGWKLGPRATVKAAYHVTWPDDVPAELAPLKPSFLTVHYLRIAENGKPKRVIDYYRGQANAKQTDVRPAGQNTWIERVAIVPGQKDQRRSVDVFITSPQAATAPAMGIGVKPDRTKGEAEADLTIELLVVDIKDPIPRE